MGLIPEAGEEKFRCPNMLSLVSFAGMTLNKCAVLRIGTLTGGPSCRKSHPLCRLTNPTVVYMTTCRLSSCKTGVYNVHLLIILERGCSSMYRKKKKEYLQRLPFLGLGDAVFARVVYPSLTKSCPLCNLKTMQKLKLCYFASSSFCDKIVSVPFKISS